jgi:hypothetical protein
MLFHVAILISLLGLPAPTSQDADSAVALVMRGTGPDVHNVSVLTRVSVSSELDLVLALGGPPAQPVAGGAWVWSAQSRLGLLLQRRDAPGMAYLLAALPGPPDCYARVERATATGVVISCAPEKGNDLTLHKFVYDIRARTLVSHLEFDSFAVYRIFERGQGAVLIASDRRRLVAFDYNPAAAPAFNMLAGPEAATWTSRIRASGGTEGPEQRLYIEPDPFEPVPFGRGDDPAFTLELEKPTGPQSSEPRLLVVERSSGAAARHPPPQSTYDQFAAARPARVANGYGRDGATIDENIGPRQVEGGRLWFGKTFYDGEGFTGVGGFGYFDPASRAYRIFSPPQIRDCSITALLVEPDSVWLGLAINGEYGSSGRGLVRFDRHTESVESFELPDLAARIVRRGSALLVATNSGVAVVENQRVRRFFVDRTSDGRLRVAEAVIGGPQL